jgi:hypothetical protein
MQCRANVDTSSSTANHRKTLSTAIKPSALGNIEMWTYRIYWLSQKMATRDREHLRERGLALGLSPPRAILFSIRSRIFFAERIVFKHSPLAILHGI